MGHTNSTPNLSLPQFVGSDKPTWLSDVNGAMLAIDAAYGTIQAEASSAATAAAGAVTAAGAAQTAADAAATAAATAGTNASQALSTANNAATVALQAQGDASEAIGRVNGEVIASATGDGIKNRGALLNELATAANIAELTHNSVLIRGENIFKITHLSSTGATFAAQRGDESEFTNTICVLDTGGNSKQLTCSVAASGSTITNSSASVVTSGDVYYRLIK